MPSFCATALAVRSLSPVAMMIFSPLACSALMASAVVALIGSATATMPASLSPTATNIGVLPSLRQRVGRPESEATSILSASISALLPSAAAWPSTVPVTPLPVTASKPGCFGLHAAVGSAFQDRFGERMFRAPLQLAASAAPAPHRSVRWTITSVSFGLAFGQRAGLVDDQRVDLGEAFQCLRVA
jgi:hypothetical protein